MINVKLDDLLSPLLTDAFFSQYWGRKFLHLPGSEEKFINYFSWKELNQILSVHRFEPPRLRLECANKSSEELASFIRHVDGRRGQRIPYIDVAVVNKLLKEGATLVLDAVDEADPNVRATCESLASYFLVNPQANLYASWGESEGFGMHWDDHDVFVLQLSGRKHWKLYGQTRRFPLYRDIELNTARPEEVLLEVTANPGDVFYIPRGHWHNAYGVNEPSLHLTIGVNTPTGVDLISWLADDLRREETMRRDLPIFSSPNDSQAHMEKLQSLIEEQFQGNLLETYLNYRRAQLHPRTYLSFPYSATEPFIVPRNDFTVKYTGVTHTDISYDDSTDSISVSCVGQEFTFDKGILPVLKAIFDGTGLNYSDIKKMLEGVASDDDIRDLISTLIDSNLIYIVGEQ